MFLMTLDEYLKGRGIEKFSEGYSQQVEGQVKDIIEITNKPDIKVMEIGFNARYLGDVLSNIDHEQVRFEFSTPNRAGIVKPATEEEGRSLLMLVMPVMLNTY